MIYFKNRTKQHSRSFSQISKDF